MAPVRLGWATDLHLDHASPAAVARLLGRIRESFATKTWDALVVTGDIAEGGDAAWSGHVLPLLRAGGPVSFVLGNHDFYGSAGIPARRRLAASLGAGAYLRAGATWLREDVALVGADGWGDARYGDPNAGALLNDALNIADLRRAHLQGKVQGAVRRLGTAEAAALRESLAPVLALRPKKVVVATHVPPFPEVCSHRGVAGDPSGTPYFACKATGDLLLEIAALHPATNFLVLAGHTHGRASAQIRSNLRALVGAARYQYPGLQPTVVIE